MIGKVLISERPRLVSIYEFAHDTRVEKNTAYAINKVNKAVSRGDTTIELDPNKLEHKVHKGTHCYMYNRLGELMTIAYNRTVEGVDVRDGYTVNIKTSVRDYKIVEGHSRPQHGDKFSRYEGRMNALRNAYSSMQLIKEGEVDPNFEDLLTVKRFLGTFELEVNCTTISYQFMDLWLAMLSNNDKAIAEAGVKFVGSIQYTEWLAEYLLAFNNTVNELEQCEGKLNYIDKYSLFKSAIKRCNSFLF